MITHVLWDWNGTLLDDAALGLSCMNEMLERRGLPTLCDIEAYRGVFCFPVEKYYESVGLPPEDFDQTAREWVALYYSRDHLCPLREGVLDALAALKARGVTQSICSAQERTLLRRQVDARGIAPYFDEILGIDDIYAGSKAYIAKAWLARAGVRAEHTLFVGDTLHDFDVSRAIGCRCALIAGGHQSKALLEQAGCPVSDSPLDVLGLMD